MANLLNKFRWRLNNKVGSLSNLCRKIFGIERDQIID